MIIKIYVTLKPQVLDPQGKTIHQALHSLGYDEVEDVRLGKYIVLHLETDNQEKARQRVEEMCQRLLANPVIEDYWFDFNMKGSCE